MRRAWWLLLLGTLCPGQSLAQSCPLPPVLQPVSQAKNIFADQQESDLGDILSDVLVSDESVIADDDLSAHLREVAAKIVRYLPENHFRLHFSLIELPEANAFSLPGGRVYVSRKLVASLRNDDELAAILAHELGHVMTHQSAIFMTQVFQQVLNADSVTDRSDIAEKIQRVRETWATHKLRIHDSEDANQQAADQVALYAMARAGFKLQSFVDALDRTTDVHGKTGNWITDLFHTTKPEQKRLREVVRSIGAMPSACIAAGQSMPDSVFADWRLQVIAYKQPAGHEQLTGVLFRKRLSQPLRPNIFNFHFSADGKYILAQDEGGIHVLSHDPLKDLFFIEASDAHRASFTPDSSSIVFYTQDLRIETWNVASQQRVLVREMALNTPCVQTALAPDGKTLACYDTDGNLWLFDTATGNSIFERRDFFHPSRFGLFFIGVNAAVETSSEPGLWQEAAFLFVNLGFSPDGRYFLAGSVLLAGDESNAFVYDLIERHETSVGRGVRNAIKGQFVFLGNDRILAVDQRTPSKSPVVAFPSGEKLEELPLATDVHIQASADGAYLIAGPSKDFAIALLNVKDKSLQARIKLNAADIYRGAVVFEEGDGTLSLVDLSSQKNIGNVNLKQSRLGLSSAIAVSSDFRWLAASTRTRGAIWDLNTNTRTYNVRGFRGGWFGEGPSFYADFPKSGELARSIVKLDLTGGTQQVSKAYEVGKLDAQQFGRYLLVTTADLKSPSHRSWTFELRDFTANTTFWSRTFTQDYPSGSWDTDAGRALFWWETWQPAAKSELKNYPDLKSAAKDGDYFFEVLDLHKDAVASAFLVNTNKRSFEIKECSFNQSWMAITTKDNRVITYSLTSGKESGHVFGYSPLLSAESGVLVVPLSDTILNIYDLATTELRTRLKFGAAVIFRAFSSDGKKLLIMTNDQTIYLIDPLADAGNKADLQSGTRLP